MSQLGLYFLTDFHWFDISTIPDTYNILSSHGINETKENNINVGLKK